LNQKKVTFKKWVKMDIKEFLEIQREFDKKYLEHKNLPVPEQIRHITLHIGKMIGKFSTYCEQQEHGVSYDLTQIINEAIPDLLMHSLRLSNLLNEDLEELYKDRLEILRRKIEKYEG